MTAKAPTPKPDVERPKAPCAPPRKEWKFKDEREDTISFPPGLTRSERRAIIREQLAEYDRMKLRNEYDYPNYEHCGDSLAQATCIVDIDSTTSKPIVDDSHPSPIERKLQQAVDLLICVCDVMPHMDENYAVALRNAIQQFLQKGEHEI